MSVRSMRQREAKEFLDRGEGILLDVRTKEEYAEAHIPNSISIPLKDLEDRFEDDLPNKDAKILIYCRSGYRSEVAGEILQDFGYTNVYNIGGIQSWPFEIVGK